MRLLGRQHGRIPGGRRNGSPPFNVVSGIPAVGNSFDPISLHPFAWYDPSDLSTLFKDAAMTTPVSADGDPVGAMQDKSGNGHHITQSVAGSRPLYKTSAGLSWLEFDGVDDNLNVLYSLSQPIDRVCGLRFLEVLGNGGAMVSGGTANACVLYISGGVNELRIYAGTELTGLAQAASGADFVATARFNGASSRVAIDNGSYQTGDAGANASDGMTLGSNGDSSDMANCRFYGLVERGSAFADSEIAQLRTYFGAKQGRVL